MRATNLTLGLLVIVLLDFGCPFIGGAFTFDPAGSAEALRLEPSRSVARVQVARLTPGPGAEVVIRRPDVKTPGPAERLAAMSWLVELRRAHVPPPGSSASPDDH